MGYDEILKVDRALKYVLNKIKNEGVVMNHRVVISFTTDEIDSLKKFVYDYELEAVSE